MTKSKNGQTEKTQRSFIFDYWDSLSEQLIIDFPNDTGMTFDNIWKLPPGIECLVIERDRQYHLTGYLEGKDEMEVVAKYVDDWKSKSDALPVGTVLPDNTIKISAFGSEYKIDNFHITSSSVTSELIAGRPVTRYRMGFHLDGVSYLRNASFPFGNNTNSAQHMSALRNYRLVDWFLNAPNEHLLRPTEWIHYEDYTIKDSDTASEHAANFQRRRVSRGSGFKFSYFKFQYHQFLVKVRKIDTSDSLVSPHWSNKLAIEYHCQSSLLPTEEQRKTITELVSFVLGRHLLRVGSSGFLRNEKIMFDAISPWGSDVISICKASDDKPIDLDILEENTTIENLIEQLLPIYEKQRNELQIHELIWALWIAKRMQTGLDLPIYASAIEAMSSTYLKKQSWNSRIDFFTNADRDAIIEAVTPLLSINHYKDEIVSKIRSMSCDGLNNNLRDSLAMAIEPIVLKNRYRDIVMDKINKVRDISIGERIRIFFREIDLAIGGAEDQAIKARNDVVHRLSLLNNDADSSIRHGYTYRALVHRVILKLLSYEGEYIDYSQPGFPSRPLSEAQGR